MNRLARRVSLASALLVACGEAPSTPPRDATLPDVIDAAVATDGPRDATRDVPADVPSPNPRCPNGVALPYPAVTEIADEAPIPDLRFGSLALRDRYTPCATTPDLLVIRVMAAWSGHAQWHAAHTNALRRSALGSRVKVLDLLVLGAQNLPATADDLAPWRARYDAPPDELAADPAYALRPYFLAAPKPPLVLYIDPRTMIPLVVQENPTQEEVTDALARAAAAYAGEPRPPRPMINRVDGRFSPDEWAFLQTLSPLGPPPRDPTNRVADDPRAIALGERLFADTGFSPTNGVSCATCHAPQRDFADGRPQGFGLRRLDRNSPAVRVSAYFRWQFWDGRADSLWSQALGPVENPSEMGFTRLGVAHRLAARYRDEYTALFGPLPALDEAARFPAGGRPGDPAWEAMTPSDQDAVNRVFSNFGKALAAFERTLRPGTTAFDRYLAGDFNAMTPRARDGLRLFLDAGCAQCHHGPALSDDSFHNIGMGTGRMDGAGDRGRYDGVPALLSSPFRADGPYSDDRAVGAHLAGLARADAMDGMFRTPTLRNVARTGPWGHGGTLTTLEAVVLHYADIARGMNAERGVVGALDPHLVGFHRDPNAALQIADALRAMSE